MDDRLLDAAGEILAAGGLESLTLERVAERAGSSRVTLWRQGVGRQQLLDGLLARLTRDFQAAMLPALATEGSARDRLVAVVRALCDVADRHLPLLAVSDEVFHWAADRSAHTVGRRVGFLDPFLAALRTGSADGSVRADLDPVDTADALFNMTCWGYVHLRHRHLWSAERARTAVTSLVVDGVAPARPVTPPASR